MSPEQKAAIEAVRHGEPIRTAVDARSDVYSLGLVLYETLGGPIPLPEGTQPGSFLRKAGMNPGLADLVSRTLQPEAELRYPTAREVGQDLSRHLGDLPLRGVRNRLGERWRKWRRREPYALARWYGGVLVMAAALAAVALAVGYHSERNRWDAQRDVYERRQQAEQRRRLTNRLHELANRVRTLWSAEQLRRDPDLEEGCRSLWERREEVLAGLGAHEQADDRLRADLLDLVLLWPELQVLAAPADQGGLQRRAALAVLDEAERLFGPSPVLYRRRERLARELGLDDLARDSARRARELAPRNGREHYALGRLYFRDGEPERAAGSFAEAARQEPRSMWPYFYLGICAYRMGQHEDAVLAFTAAAARSDGAATACLYNRALAYEAWGQPLRALRDYDEVVRLDPNFASAYLNRGLLHYRAGRHEVALYDLEQALQRGARPVAVYYNLALIHVARGDRGTARTCLKRALAEDPRHEHARAFLRQLGPR
jgi:tetratricopeptide (TPR) repeat protein